MKWLVPLLLVLGGVAVWWFARSGGAAPATTTAIEAPVEGAAPAEAAAPGEVLREPGSAAVVAREEAPAARAAREVESPIASARATSTVFHGLVLDALTRAPIQGVRALISSSKRNVAPTERAPEEIEVEAKSDAAGRFQLALPEGRAYGIAQLVADGYGSVSFVHDLAHDAPERAEVIELLSAAALEVRVLDPQGPDRRAAPGGFRERARAGGSADGRARRGRPRGGLRELRGRGGGATPDRTHAALR